MELNAISKNEVLPEGDEISDLMGIVPSNTCEQASQTSHSAMVSCCECSSCLQEKDLKLKQNDKIAELTRENKSVEKTLKLLRKNKEKEINSLWDTYQDCNQERDDLVGEVWILEKRIQVYENEKEQRKADLDFLIQQRDKFMADYETECDKFMNLLAILFPKTKVENMDNVSFVDLLEKKAKSMGCESLAFENKINAKNATKIK